MPFISRRTIGLAVFASAVTACGGGGSSGSGGGDPVPPAPYIVAADVVFPVSTLDAVWDERRQVLYLSLPSSAGPNGNLVVALDPRTNKIVRSQFAGSEPTKLALSDDGQFLYAGINGSGSVQRFKLPDLTPDLNIPLKLDDFSGVQHAIEIQVMPGSPRSVVVARGYYSPSVTTTRTELYDDAIARPESLSWVACTCGSMQWGNSPIRLYAANNQNTGFNFYDIDVDASGLHLAKSVMNVFHSFYAHIHYSPASGLLYSDEGTVFDPEAARTVGVVNARGPMVPDPSRNRLYFATAVGSAAISGFDSSTLKPVGVDRRYSENSTGSSTKLVRWGIDGLAVVESGSSVHLFGGAGIPSFNATVPVGNFAQSLIPGTINRMAWDSVGGYLYASVSGASSSSPNSILVIDPSSGNLIATKRIGSEPNALAVSDDGQFLYVGLDDAGAVQRLRLPGLELDVTLPLGSHPFYGPYAAGDLKVRPGAAHTVAVSRISLDTIPRETGGIRIYDDAIPRPVEAPATDPRTLVLHNYYSLDWSLAGTQLFSGSIWGDLDILNVDLDGVRNQKTINAMFTNAGSVHVDRTNGLIYHDTGRVVDPGTGRPLGIYVTGPGSQFVASDAASNRAFTLMTENGSNVHLVIYDKARFTPQRAFTIPYQIGLPYGFVQTGPKGVAFVTTEGLHVVRLDPS